MTLPRLLTTLALALLPALAGAAGEPATASPAAAPREVRFGVLAFRTVEQTARQWEPLAAYLESRVENTRFRIVPLLVDQVEQHVRAARVDFLLVNPEPYVTLAPRFRLAALATQVSLAGGRPVSRFGGVIFARADRADLQGFESVAGRKVAAVTERSFAGFLAQKWSLSKRGVDLDSASLVYTGLPQDRVVQAVVAGEADIGFVRTGLIEAMEKEGKVRPGLLRVIEAPRRDDYPLALSTDLYPEWPVAALAHVPDATTKAVALALLNLEPTHPAAQAAGIYGFAPPGDYASIEALLLRLRAHPDRFAMFGLAEVLQKYALQAIGLAFVLAVAALLALLYFRRQNRRLEDSLSETRRLAQREELLDSLSEGVYGVDLAGQCSFINESALAMLGLRADEVLGRDQHALFHHHHPDGRPYAQHDCPVRRTLADGQRREGEESFFHASGAMFPVRMAVRAIRRNGAIAGAVVAFQDIREEKAAAERIRDLALHDPLTGLPNRRLIWDRLGVELARAGREGTGAAVLFIDLDGFKDINDRHGHETGDAVLVAAAARLRDNVRAADAVGRLGGDEFVVVLAGTRDRADAEGVAAKLIEALADPIPGPAAGPCTLTGSIGIALYPEHGRDAAGLVHNADLAMYEAKRAGKNRYAVHSGQDVPA